MNKKFISIFIIFTALIIQSCTQDNAQQTIERVIAVKTQTVQLSSEKLTRTYTGSLEGEQQAVIRSKIAEAVDEVHVREGDKITESQVLISLDKFGPSSQFSQAQSLYVNSQKNFEKMIYLFKEGAVSESQFDAAKTEYDINKASFEAATKLVEIESPLTGTVTSIAVSLGEYLSPGQILATVATTDKLKIKFGVNVDEYSFIKEGAHVRIYANSDKEFVVGRIASVAKSADPISRAVQVEVLVDNYKQNLSPGMFARIVIVLEEIENVIIIPRSSVIELDKQATVFLVSGGRAVRKNIELGMELDGQVVVNSGLSVGDTLVTVGHNFLDDDFKVNIINNAKGE